VTVDSMTYVDVDFYSNLHINGHPEVWHPLCGTLCICVHVYHYAVQTECMTFKFLNFRINKLRIGCWMELLVPERGQEIFPSPWPVRFWDPHNLIYSWYQLLSRGLKQPQLESDHSLSCSAKFQWAASRRGIWLITRKTQYLTSASSFVT
jgi:hypothetical protein